MAVIKFPTKLPEPDRLDLPQAQLCALLQSEAQRYLTYAKRTHEGANGA